MYRGEDMLLESGNIAGSQEAVVEWIINVNRCYDLQRPGMEA